MIFIRGNIKIYTPERGSGLQVLILLKWNGGGKGGDCRHPEMERRKGRGGTADTLKWNGGGEGGTADTLKWNGGGEGGDCRHPEIVLSSY